MNENRFSLNRILLLAACLIFDAALIIIFFKKFSLFNSLDNAKSALVLLVLLIGLAFITLAIAFQADLTRKFGTAYSTSVILLIIFYGFAANIASINSIPLETVWYFVWQLVVFAVFLGIFAIMTLFPSRSASYKVEQTAKNDVNSLLFIIESAIAGKMNEKNEYFLQINQVYKTLSERIKASTPFGRIKNNNLVLNMESEIYNKLLVLHEYIEKGVTKDSCDSIKKIINDTLMLVIKREQLIIN